MNDHQTPPSASTVPYSLERTYDLPCSPTEVWDAIATARGITTWMVPTRLEERVGGAIVFQLGEELWSHGIVTAFDRPTRFAYDEPDWAALAGHDPTTVSPMATEFLIEAPSGGSCVLRIVTSAFGSGAEWENEFFTDMSSGWVPLLDNLRVLLGGSVHSRKGATRPS